MFNTGPRMRSRWQGATAAGAAVLLAGLLVACTPAQAAGGSPQISGTGSAADGGGASADGSSGSSASSAPHAVTVPSLTPTSVAPVPTTLTVKASASAVRQGTPVTLRFTLVGADAPVPGATVSVLHAGKTTNATLDPSGQGSLVLDALPGGKQQVRVTYAGDATHAGSSGSAMVTVAALTKVAVGTSATTIAPGTPAVVSITVTSGGKPVAGAVATVKYAGKTTKSPVTNASGQAKLSLSGLPGARTRSRRRTPVIPLHAPATGSLGLTVHAASAITVSASDTSPTSGDPVTIGWTVTAAGKPVAKAPVVISVGGSTIKATSGADGKGSTDLSKLKPGSVPVTVAYSGDAGHGAVAGSVKLSVIGATDVDVYANDTSVSPDDDVKVGFDVTSRAGAMGGTVTVSYAGGSHSVDLDDGGHGSVTIPAGTWSTGLHTVKVHYPGAGYYAPSSSTLDVSVTSNTSCPAWAEACVDLTNSTSWLQSDGKIVYGPVTVSSGRPGLPHAGGHLPGVLEGQGPRLQPSTTHRCQTPCSSTVGSPSMRAIRE